MRQLFEDDRGCFVCGENNTAGLRLRFKRIKKTALSSEVTFPAHLQGFKDTVHGGMIAAVLDDMLVNLAWLEQMPAVTAELTLRLKKTVLIGEPLRLESRIERVSNRIIYASAQALDKAGRVVASASAKLVRVRASRQLSCATDS